MKLKKLLHKLKKLARRTPDTMDDTCSFDQPPVPKEERAFGEPRGFMFPGITVYCLTKELAESVEFEDLIHALRNNDELYRIFIHGHFIQCLSVMQQHLFWKVLAESPVLKVVGFLDFDVDYPLHTSIVVRLLQRRQVHFGIRDIELCHVHFTGNVEELTQTLQAHHSLREITVWDVDHADDGKSQLDVLQMLVSVQHLQNLYLGCFTLEEAQIQVVAKALSHKDHQLQALRLMGGRPKTNNPHYHPTVQTKLSYESCAALASMLKANKHLVDLELTNLLMDATNSGLAVLLEALRDHNRTLKAFQLFQVNIFCRHDMTQEENEALVSMLRCNDVLVKCLPNGTGAAHDKVLWYLKLNRHKLRNAHVDINFARQELPDKIANLPDLDCIYHLMRENPSLTSA